jgi:hypothetical protein
MKRLARSSRDGFVRASESSIVWQITGPSIPFAGATAVVFFWACLLVFDNAASPNVWAEKSKMSEDRAAYLIRLIVFGETL